MDDDDDDLLLGRRRDSPTGGGRAGRGLGGGGGGGSHGEDGDAWASIDRLMPPIDGMMGAGAIGGHQGYLQRAFTPPIVPPSKVVQQQRAAAAAAAGPQLHPQVLTLGPAGGGEEMVDLVYDPVLKCYYDQKTNKYYELKH